MDPGAVGAGPAAPDLTAAGRDVMVVEAADETGGRMRTDAVLRHGCSRGGYLSGR
ncbi:FAD-dependent oxidoreductase [Kitasatospora sp. NPDC059146]|uniref:FAD-dependent oxidoreductase n=1 Tax=unclassified Kitasatospora TaxID=2633591 RepID=UPI00367B4808